MATAEWTNWSRFGTFPIVAAGGVTVAFDDRAVVRRLLEDRS